jgi:hypothetical protein
MMDLLAADIALYCDGRADAGVPEEAGVQGSARQGRPGK